MNKLSTPVPHNQVRKSVIKGAIDHIHHKPRPKSSYDPMEDFLNERAVISFDDVSRSIRARTAVLLKQVHAPVPRAIKPLALINTYNNYIETPISERITSDEYINHLLRPLPGKTNGIDVSYYPETTNKIHIGKTHLACMSFAGEHAIPKRRHLMVSGDSDHRNVRSDVELLSHYHKMREAATHAPRESGGNVMKKKNVQADTFVENVKLSTKERIPKMEPIINGTLEHDGDDKENITVTINRAPPKIKKPSTEDVDGEWPPPEETVKKPVKKVKRTTSEDKKSELEKAKAEEEILLRKEEELKLLKEEEEKQRNAELELEKKRAEEEQKLLEEKRKQEQLELEIKLKEEEEQRLLEEQRLEEQRLLEEQKRKEEEEQRLLEEQRLEEQRLLEEQKRKEEEEQRLLEEQKHKEEEERLLEEQEEQRLLEEKLAEEYRKEQEQKLEEERKLQEKLSEERVVAEKKELEEKLMKVKEEQDNEEKSVEHVEVSQSSHGETTEYYEEKQVTITRRKKVLEDDFDWGTIENEENTSKIEEENKKLSEYESEEEPAVAENLTKIEVTEDAEGGESAAKIELKNDEAKHSESLAPSKTETEDKTDTTEAGTDLSESEAEPIVDEPVTPLREKRQQESSVSITEVSSEEETAE